MQIFGIWDDHDYGKNDGGQEFEIKVESQQALLIFDVSKEDQRRTQKVSTLHLLENNYGTVELLMLDTRYFRSSQLLIRKTVGDISRIRIQQLHYWEMPNTMVRKKIENSQANF